MFHVKQSHLSGPRLQVVVGEGSVENSLTGRGDTD